MALTSGVATAGLLTYGLIGLAIFAFILIVLEDVIHLNKAKSTLFLGTLSWLLLFMFGEQLHLHNIPERLNENILEIATLWLFLMAAMTFVAYLNSKGLIRVVIYRVLPRKISERKLLLLTGGFAFIFSSLADNITATLVSVALLMSLDLPPKKLVRMAVLVVFSVNSGGVSLITGDVTTLMIFMANKVEIQHLLLLVVPAMLSVLGLALLLSIGMNGTLEITPDPTRVRRLDTLIAGLFLLTIIGTIIGNIIFSIPPLLTFLFGLSILFLVGHWGTQSESQERYILDYIRIIEYDTLLFFLGILLIVGMFKEIGALSALPLLYAEVPILAANYLTGLFSALIDNVPLTAAVLKADINMAPGEWLAFTYAAGVGGSLLVIGSAAGIIALSKVAALNFISYLKYAPLLLLAYSGGYLMAYQMGHWFLH